MSESDTVEVSAEKLDRILEENAELRSRLDDVEDNVEANAERINENDGRIDDVEDEQEEQSERIEEIEETVEEHDFDTDAHENRLNKITEWKNEDVSPRMEELNEAVGELQSEVTGVSADKLDDYTPIEKLATMSEDDLEEHTGVNEQRAVTIFRNWLNWSRTVKGGRVKETSDNLIQLLEAERDEDLEHTQLTRAIERLAELSRGTIKIDESRGKRRLVQSKDREFASVNQARDDSVTTLSAGA